MNAIELELMWSNLRSVVTEQARAMQRTAFSPVVREAGDLAYGLFDARARMLVQADTGTPGHINCLASCGTYLAKYAEGNLMPGDVLITNDPWIGAGHTFDITVFAPVFRNGRLLGFVGSTNHHTDIGGTGPNASAHDVHEEGLWIPPAKLYERGKPNAVLFDIIRANVRTPNLISGDLAAQVAACESGGAALNELCDRYGLSDIEALSDAILDHSERAMREAVRRCPAGSWTGESTFDIPGGDVVKLRAKVTIDHDAGDLLIDFDGSSPQSSRGVNVVLNYTRAYATFAIRSILNPDLPNNLGSITPIKVTAPEGSIVNCRYPAPVAARHIVGMFVPMPIMNALHHVLPDRVVASSPGSPFSMQVFGQLKTGENFVTACGLTGGMGARADKPGLAATFYPAGLGSIPIEIIETECPVLFDRAEIRRGSGGDGRMRGGDGQIVQFRVTTDKPWLLSAAASSLRYPPDGVGGGAAGQPGVFRINGGDVKTQGKIRMDPQDVIYVETPGGGGFGVFHPV
ncbi:hydantoinase B/oxoprolinase family protein [Bradyrhizobium sp. ma5]|uniref:hydantoinase B/oxoprolinase family protein n=1 Tax=Bradyrhizobium sp. ma5 TaxID=3344828 RepID=UPI0035D41E0D